MLRITQNNTTLPLIGSRKAAYMFIEVSTEEYMAFMHDFAMQNGCKLHNNGNHYKVRCIDKEGKVVSIREQLVDGTFKNYIWKETDIDES